MALSTKQLEGLAEVLPAGYPKTGGVVVLRDKKSRSKNNSRRRRSTKSTFVPWYRLFRE